METGTAGDSSAAGGTQHAAQTAADGYYNGARYHGAIQLLVEPTGRRMAGKWVGFGQDFDVNTGPWDCGWWTGPPARRRWRGTACRRSEGESINGT